MSFFSFQFSNLSPLSPLLLSSFHMNTIRGGAPPCCQEMTPRLVSFAKSYGIGLVLGGLVAARHCYDILDETTKEVTSQLERIESYNKLARSLLTDEVAGGKRRNELGRGHL